MNNLTQNDIKEAIINYLESALHIEVMKSFKDKKPNQKSIDNKIKKLKPDYEYYTWLRLLKESLLFMQSHDLSLATHISKGIHSSVRSDNLIVSQNLDGRFLGFVNFSDVPNPEIDANSNNTGSHAGHLKIIISFLNIKISQGRFYSFIKSNNSVFKDFFEQQLSIDFFDYLVQLLNYKVLKPITDARNKQTLFPIGGNHYHCIIPLYPASLTYYVHESIKNIRYSDFTKNAKKIRFHVDEAKQEPLAYRDIRDLAVVKLGGENAQNVSRLNNVQGGFHYLLPSLPPSIDSKQTSFKPSKFATSIFSTALANKVAPALQYIYTAIDSKPNNVSIRDMRKKAMVEIISQLFEFATYMRNELPAGWTLEYELDEVETFWLDPRRAELPNQQNWQAKREDPSNDWHKQIIHRFARWLNSILQDRFPDNRNDFADSEHFQWERDIEDMQKQYERAGKGVFL